LCCCALPFGYFRTRSALVTFGWTTFTAGSVFAFLKMIWPRCHGLGVVLGSVDRGRLGEHLRGDLAVGSSG